MDANGRMSGDRGYDQGTEQVYQPQEAINNGAFYGKVGEPEKISESEQWAKDHPAQQMAPIDYSAAPDWWNNGRGGSNYGKIGAMEDAATNVAQNAVGGKIGQGQPEAPSYAPAAPQQPRMIDYIGDVGGRTGITTTSPLSAALRGATPATGGSNGESISPSFSRSYP